MELSRATLGRWTGAVAELLEPLYDVLRQYVLMPGKVHADDIPVPVQEPGSGKTRTARTGKASIHRIILLVTAECFRPMLTVVTGRYTNPAE